MSKKQDDPMADLQRLLASQHFQSEEEIHRFMEGLMDKPIPSAREMPKSPQAKALYLVEMAMNQEEMENALDLIEEALSLDPDCINAYNFLGDVEEREHIATVFYEKGMLIGRRLFGGDFLAQHKGHFWYIHETRPFMRSMSMYADCLYHTGRPDEAMAIQEELIELQPYDPMGIRDTLMLYLAASGPVKKFKKYDKLFAEDTGTFLQLHRALFAFRQEGESAEASRLLRSALAQNKHLAKLMLSKKPIVFATSNFILGNESEAEYIAEKAREVWASVTGALDWLKKQSGKGKS
jgi:tetratricopeptide (TPR) repeat protein